MRGGRAEKPSRDHGRGSSSRALGMGDRPWRLALNIVTTLKSTKCPPRNLWEVKARDSKYYSAPTCGHHAASLISHRNAMASQVCRSPRCLGRDSPFDLYIGERVVFGV